MLAKKILQGDKMIYISTNMYKPESVMSVTKILDHFSKDEVGIELFIFNNSEDFIREVNENIDRLKEYSITFHGPYLQTDHSAPKGSDLYNRTIELYKQSLEFDKALKPKYIVFHTNNKIIEEKQEMIKNAFKNLDEIKGWSKTPLVIENAGVGKNSLFDEEEFIKAIQNREENTLIDIGHVKANGWDLENVIENLKDKIVSYHIHTNDGKHDQHLSVSEDYDELKSFVKLYKKYTPNADLVLEYNSTYEGKESLVVEDVKELLEDLK
jgi:putative sugar phosphate isomerase/epimerase